MGAQLLTEGDHMFQDELQSIVYQMLEVPHCHPWACWLRHSVAFRIESQHCNAVFGQGIKDCKEADKITERSSYDTREHAWQHC